jgi:hypothetical protein
MAGISSVLGSLLHPSHDYNLLYFQSQKPIKIKKKLSR